MKMRGSTNKSSIKLNMQQKINWHYDLFMNRENQHSKKPLQEILRSPLPRIHYYQNKRLQVKEFSTLYQPTVEPLPQYLIGLVL